MSTTAAEISIVDAESDRRVDRRVPWGALTHPTDTRSNGSTSALALPPYAPYLLTEAAREHLSSVSAPKRDDEISHFLNITVAAFGLLLAAPLFLLIALAIKVSSRGPVFYKQTRIGFDRRWQGKPARLDRRSHDLGGRPFSMYKFRTMVACAEPDSKETWATPTDERVTPLGRLLRVTRLDEMPQLLNVLNGDMNIVGPRPERPTIFAELRRAIPTYPIRQRVMPGITGWAQINQSYDTCVDDVRRKVELDLEYLQSRSAVGDLSIMARTVPIMLFGKLGW